MQFLQSAVLNPVAWANLLFCLGGHIFVQPPPQPVPDEQATAELVSNVPNAASAPTSAPSSVRTVQQDFHQLCAVLHKLQQLFKSVSRSFPGNQICTMQAWMSSTCVASSHHYLYAEPTLLHIGDETYQSFREQSCKAMMEWRQGMPGRVWKSGAVQVIQNSRIIPPCLHPVNKLHGVHLSRLGEMVYIPVFDSSNTKAPVAILEALLSRQAADPMLVANLISYVGQELESLQLSLCHPNPPPLKKASFSGRRPRPSSSELSKDNQAVAKEPMPDGQEKLGVAANGASRKLRRLDKMGRCKTLHNISSALKAAQEAE